MHKTEITGKGDSDFERRIALMKGKPNPARQAYLKKWRKDHPEKISEYNRRYWEKQLDKWNKEHGVDDGSKAKEDVR